MKWKNRLTNYNFWISIVSAVLLILQAFEINFDIAYINEIATAVLGLLVVIGIISYPTKSSVSNNAVNEVLSDSVKTKPINEEKVEDDVKDKMIEEQTIPFDAEDENDNVNIQDDFKVLIAEIRKDIETMTERMSNITLEAKTKKVTEVSNVPTIEDMPKEVEDISMQTSYNIVN